MLEKRSIFDEEVRVPARQIRRINARGCVRERARRWFWVLVEYRGGTYIELPVGLAGSLVADQIGQCVRQQPTLRKLAPRDEQVSE